MGETRLWLALLALSSACSDSREGARPEVESTRPADDGPTAPRADGLGAPALEAGGQRLWVLRENEATRFRVEDLGGTVLANLIDEARLEREYPLLHDRWREAGDDVPVLHLQSIHCCDEFGPDD